MHHPTLRGPLDNFWQARIQAFSIVREIHWILIRPSTFGGISSPDCPEFRIGMRTISGRWFRIPGQGSPSPTLGHCSGPSQIVCEQCSIPKGTSPSTRLSNCASWTLIGLIMLLTKIFTCSYLFSLSLLMSPSDILLNIFVRLRMIIYFNFCLGRGRRCFWRGVCYLSKREVYSGSGAPAPKSI